MSGLIMRGKLLVKQCNVLCDLATPGHIYKALSCQVSDAVFIKVGDAGYGNKCCPVWSKIDRQLNPYYQPCPPCHSVIIQYFQGYFYLGPHAPLLSSVAGTFQESTIMTRYPSTNSFMVNSPSPSLSRLSKMSFARAFALCLLTWVQNKIISCFAF